MGWGENGASRPTTDAYRNSPYWDSVEKKKKEEEKKKKKSRKK